MSAATQDWRTLPAGRELDALVAERVFRADVHEGEYDTYWTLPGERYISDQRTMPAFSTDIAAAWQVVEKMREHPNVRFRSLSLVAWCYNRTYATFDAEAFSEYRDDAWSEANGEHATPHAICRAALSATEGQP